MIYLSVTTRIVIGQFSGPFSTARPAKIKAVFVATISRDFAPNVLSFY